MSLTGVSCLDAIKRFWFNGNFLKIWFGLRFSFSCCFNKNLCLAVVRVPTPTCIVLADPIWDSDWYNFILDLFWFGPGIIGSTKYVRPVSKPGNASLSGL